MKTNTVAEKTHLPPLARCKYAGLVFADQCEACWHLLLDTKPKWFTAAGFESIGQCRINHGWEKTDRSSS